MEFVLTGFHQEDNIRRYRFQGIANDRKRSEFTVGVDLALIRKHRIPMQELPLLCRGLLEIRPPGDPANALTYTEKDMLGYASRRAAEQELAEHKRRGHHRPPLPNRMAKNGHTP